MNRQDISSFTHIKEIPNKCLFVSVYLQGSCHVCVCVLCELKQQLLIKQSFYIIIYTQISCVFGIIVNLYCSTDKSMLNRHLNIGNAVLYVILLLLFLKLLFCRNNTSEWWEVYNDILKLGVWLKSFLWENFVSLWH